MMLAELTDRVSDRCQHSLEVLREHSGQRWTPEPGGPLLLVLERANRKIRQAPRLGEMRVIRGDVLIEPVVEMRRCTIDGRFDAQLPEAIVGETGHSIPIVLEVEHRSSRLQSRS